MLHNLNNSGEEVFLWQAATQRWFLNRATFLSRTFPMNSYTLEPVGFIRFR